MTKITYKEQQKNNILNIEDIDIEGKEIELLLRMLRQETKDVADNIDIKDIKEAKINCRTIKDIADKIMIILKEEQ